ncbi:MAG: hypothetical protein C0600_00995 [Ignavibacteria bacterium]|nr:MAG: hypothetical protein C0600_00995 [Ignavibacteria bacterium]
MIRSRILVPALVVLFSAQLSHAQNIFTTLPDSIDTARHYMFYIHDNVVHAGDVRPSHPEFGTYEYEEIVNRLSTEGFSVISYPREKGAHPYLYAQETAEQIRHLIAEGVPAAHISIVGAGSGGTIAILLCTILKNKDLNVVVLSTCTERYVAFWTQNDETLCGNVLSIYHADDKAGAPCRPFLEACSKSVVSQYREISLGGDSPIGFYYKDALDWVMPTILWSSGKYDLVRE